MKTRQERLSLKLVYCQDCANELVTAELDALVEEFAGLVDAVPRRPPLPEAPLARLAALEARALAYETRTLEVLIDETISASRDVGLGGVLQEWRSHNPPTESWADGAIDGWPLMTRKPTPGAKRHIPGSASEPFRWWDQYTGCYAPYGSRELFWTTVDLALARNRVAWPQMSVPKAPRRFTIPQVAIVLLAPDGTWWCVAHRTPRYAGARPEKGLRGVEIREMSRADPAWVAISLVLLAERLSRQQGVTHGAHLAGKLKLAPELAADDRCQCGYVAVRLDGHRVCAQCGALEMQP